MHQDISCQQSELHALPISSPCKSVSCWLTSPFALCAGFSHTLSVPSVPPVPSAKCQVPSARWYILVLVAGDSLTRWGPDRGLLCSVPHRDSGMLLSWRCCGCNSEAGGQGWRGPQRGRGLSLEGDCEHTKDTPNCRCRRLMCRLLISRVIVGKPF
jgi:hypothetical protein